MVHSEAPGTMELHNVSDYVNAFSSGIWTLLYLTLNPFTVFVACVILVPVNFFFSWLRVSDEEKRAIASKPILKRPISQRFPHSFQLSVLAQGVWVCLYLFICLALLSVVLVPTDVYLEKEKELSKYIFLRENGDQSAFILKEPYESEYQRRLLAGELNSAQPE